MNNKENIAEENGVDLNTYQIRDIVVTKRSLINIFPCVFLLVIGILLIIIAIACKGLVIVLIAGILLGGALIVFAFVELLKIFTFQLTYKEGKILYHSLSKKCFFDVSSIQYFKMERGSNHSSFLRFDKIEIVYKGGRILKYEVDCENKEHFVFLLDLLKSGIKQR